MHKEIEEIEKVINKHKELHEEWVRLVATGWRDSHIKKLKDEALEDMELCKISIFYKVEKILPELKELLK